MIGDERKDNMDIRSLKISFSQEDRKDILAKIDDALENGNLSQGKYVNELEHTIKNYTNVKNAVAVNSATSGIEMVMRILNVKDKTVLVPTNTFLATASGVLFAGGKVRFVDTDPKTMSISLEGIKKQYTEDTVGVIIVHIGGIITPEIENIKAWCDEKGIWLFEDAAHAHGSVYNSKQAGMFGIAASYSLFATKVITCGEGGYVVTNDDELAKKMRLYRNHGKGEAWVTYNSSIGNNYRMSDIVATIALNQFSHLDEIIMKREKIADYYTKYLKEHMEELQVILPQEKSSWYKYSVILPDGISRDNVKEKMKETGIELQGEVYGIPLHQQPATQYIGEGLQFPNADYICKQSICLPIYPDLKREEQEFVVKQLCSIIKELA